MLLLFNHEKWVLQRHVKLNGLIWQYASQNQRQIANKHVELSYLLSIIMCFKAVDGNNLRDKKKVYFTHINLPKLKALNHVYTKVDKKKQILLFHCDKKYIVINFLIIMYKMQNTCAIFLRSFILVK